MTIPTLALPGLPADANLSILVGWDDANAKFAVAQVDASGNLKSSASIAAGDGPTVGTITSVSGSASDVTVLAANTSRKGATVFNDSAAILYLALSDTTSSSTVYTVQVPADGYYEIPLSEAGVYTGVIKGIWASATGAARVTELT